MLLGSLQNVLKKRVPDARLDTVMTYLETLLHDIPLPASQNQSLKGIWGDAGFEKMTNLEQELYTVRQELQADILKRTF